MDTGHYSFESFYNLIQTLRSPEGCPWDRKQTIHSMRKFLLEECYETISAINDADDDNTREELGDILLIVTMMSVIAEEQKKFSIHEVIENISKKIIRRHPHVFANDSAENPEEVETKWNAIKEQEKETKGNPNTEKKQSSAFIPESFPEIERAYRIQKAAEKSHFDWNNPQEIFNKLQEEIHELETAVKDDNQIEIEEEIGDILFTVINIARKLKVHPSIALHGTNEKFLKRFGFVEEAMKKNDLEMHSDTMNKMEEFWHKSKSSLG